MKYRQVDTALGLDFHFSCSLFSCSSRFTWYCALPTFLDNDWSHFFVDAIVDVVDVSVKCVNFQSAVESLSMFVERQLNISPPAKHMIFSWAQTGLYWDGAAPAETKETWLGNTLNTCNDSTAKQAIQLMPMSCSSTQLSPTQPSLPNSWPDSARWTFGPNI